MGCAASCDYPEVAAAPPLRNRRCILPDLLGSGYSDQPLGFSYSMRAHAKTVVELIRHLRLPKVCLYGHSMSGAVAIVAAEMLGKRVSRLVLSEPNLDPGGGWISRRIAEQSQWRYVSTGHQMMIREARKKGQQTWATTMALSSPLAIHREAVSLIEGSHPSWREILAELPMPRTCIFGRRSLPDPDTGKLRSIGVRIRIVPNAGHGMAQDNPGGLARALAAAIR